MKINSILFLFTLILLSSCSNKQPIVGGIEAEGFTQNQIDSVLTNFEFNYDDPKFINGTSKILMPITTQFSEESTALISKGRGKVYDNIKWNFLFYDFSTGESHLLSDKKIRILNYRINIEKVGKVLSKSILYEICDNDFNLDKELNNLDAKQLFISKNDGTELTRLTPTHERLDSYTIVPFSDQILIKTRKDSNRDYIFDSNDETVWYQLNLDSSELKLNLILDSTMNKKIHQLYFDNWIKK
jgi:hypothetical protein